MTRDEAIAYLWEVHDTYFIQHPKAKTYTCAGLDRLLCDILPTEDERDDLFAALDVEQCVTCLEEQGIDPDTYCPLCAARAIAFAEDEDA